MSVTVSWNDAANAATEDIFNVFAKIIDLNDSPAPTIDDIRIHFDESEKVIGQDVDEKNKFEQQLRSAKCWMKLGALAIIWGMNNGYKIHREELLATLVRKQHDYGHDNIGRYGTTGILIRVHDKIARLENLTEKKLFPSNESIADTLIDIAGYSAIGIMWCYDQFMLPLEAA